MTEPEPSELEKMAVPLWKAELGELVWIYTEIIKEYEIIGHHWLQGHVVRLGHGGVYVLPLGAQQPRFALLGYLTVVPVIPG